MRVRELRCFAHRILLQLLLLTLAAVGARAHDPSAYGGVFRSRNLGGTWLSADIGLFLNAALVVAINPKNQAHLFAGTDLGVLASRNGGLTWAPEAPDLMFGAVFAITFLNDGEGAICAAQSGVFRLSAGRWTTADVPEAAVPARAVVPGASANRVYLLGRQHLFISVDGGKIFVPAPAASETSAMSALTVARSEHEALLAVIDGQVMASEDGGRQWRARGLGRQGDPVDQVAADPHVPQRVWAAQAGRIYVSDDLGAAWRTIGSALPEPATVVRDIAANAEATVLLVSSNRGLYRSENGGETWTLKEDNLPIHLEAGPLARDPGDAGLIYAVYSLMPYAEVWRFASEGGNLLQRLDPISLAGGVAFWLLILLAGGWLAQRLLHRRAATTDDRT
jgi:photosystem II stability/assembly factor-like uncharacterized protein